jgi:ubiquinone/menaquinone biosynthesis C-methylase UbiE
MKLGLPLEYKKLPEFFDAHNVCENTTTKNQAIEKLLKKYAVKSVLDMTCGTGSQVFHLLNSGYQVTGSDFSSDLIKIARDKSLSQKKSVEFIEGDVRNLKVGKFDAVITMFNAIGHLNRSDFAKAIRNIRRNLKTGGIYIFDIFNLAAMTDKTVAELAYLTNKKVNGIQVLQSQCSTIDREKGLLTSYDSYMIQNNAEIPKILHNKFTLQIYNAQELQDILSKNGFETLGQYDIYGEKFIPSKTINILTVAQKR